MSLRGSRSNRLVSIFPRAIASQSPITSEMRSLFSHHQCDRIQWTFHHRSSPHTKAIAFPISKRAIALPTKTRSHTAGVSPSLISPEKSDHSLVKKKRSPIPYKKAFAYSGRFTIAHLPIKGIVHSRQKSDRSPVNKKRSPLCNHS